MAPELALARPEEEIRRYLALHDWLLSRRDKRIARNPPGFLAACIANQLPFPRESKLVGTKQSVREPVLLRSGHALPQALSRLRRLMPKGKRSSWTSLD